MPPSVVEISPEVATQIEALEVDIAESARIASHGLYVGDYPAIPPAVPRPTTSRPPATSGTQAPDPGAVRWISVLGSGLHGAAASEGRAPVRVERLRDESSPVDTNAIVISAARRHADLTGEDVSLFRRACASVVTAAERGQTIILASALHVGSTRELLIAPLERRGFEVGRDIHVAFCPVRELSATHDVLRTRAVGGATSRCADAATAIVERLGAVEIVATPEEAEAAALSGLSRSLIGAALKRAMDIAIAAVGLVLLLPLFIPVALAILLDDGRPIHFSQVRIGRNGRAFRVHKFRTMTREAEDRLSDVLHMNQIRGPAFQIDRDPRLTRIRRTATQNEP